MNIFIGGAALAISLALATPTLAKDGQCSFTGFGTFDCQVELDGSGLTFELPDGQTFAFAVVAEDEGLGYRIAADATPGQRPVELGEFTPVSGEAGCWQSQKDETRFCAAVQE